MEDDEEIIALPLLDERGYEIVLDENGEVVLDEDGNPAIFGYGAIIVADVW